MNFDRPYALIVDPASSSKIDLELAIVGISHRIANRAEGNKMQHCLNVMFSNDRAYFLAVVNIPNNERAPLNKAGMASRKIVIADGQVPRLRDSFGAMGQYSRHHPQPRSNPLLH